MLAWNIANVWESVAAAQPDQPTIVQGEQVWSSARLDKHADAFASALLDAGLERQAKVAVYLYNCPQFLAAYLGAFKARMAPVNVNYRYESSELHYLFDNADAEAIVFDVSFAPKLEAIRARLPRVKLWLAVGADVPAWATSFDALTRTEQRVDAAERSADDLMLLYTGGTTGSPKGVMWRQEDLIGVGGFFAGPLQGVPPLEAPEEAGPRAQRLPRLVSCIPCPLMHGTGLFSALRSLQMGGTIVLLPRHSFDAEALWDQVERWHVTRISIVGEPFARPMLEALDAFPRRWQLQSVELIVSSGAMWSRETKQGLLRHMPEVLLGDGLSSSEAMGLGNSYSRSDAPSDTARFSAGASCAVFDDAGQRVSPGSGQRGRVAVTGHIPLGYYKDPAKSAQAFPVLEGRRWSMPGDYAEIAADGTLVLLGRGSQCINTGGEKVFPEEVEEALKRHAAVRDSAVVGIADERYGERICAVVALREHGTASESALIAHTKTQLAAYKAPRHVFFVDQLQRAPNGKLDYTNLKHYAQQCYVALG